MTATVAGLTDTERAALQRRVLRVLTGGQIVGAAALGAAVTVGAFVVQDILGDETPFGGIATATFTTGTACMAQALSRLMWRRGRRPGLQLGYGLATVGGVTAAIGAERGVLAVFLAGLFLFGSGQASNLLARYAATDLADPEHRSRAMSRVVFASTFGAVFGPLLIAPAQRAGEVWFGLDRYTGPWLLGAVCFVLAMVNTWLRLRPDPLVAAGGLSITAGTTAPPMRHSLGVIRGVPLARLALASMAVSQGAMVAVMTMTPVHMKLHGHETLSPYVISVHIGGMFAFSPLVGRFADRRGRIPAVLTGATILLGSTLLASVAGAAEWLLLPVPVGARAGMELRADRRLGAAVRVRAGERSRRRAGSGRSADEPVRRARRVLVGVHPACRRLPRPRRDGRGRRRRAARRRLPRQPARVRRQADRASRLAEETPQRVRRPRAQAGGGEQLEVAVALPRRLGGVACGEVGGDDAAVGALPERLAGDGGEAAAQRVERQPRASRRSDDASSACNRNCR